MNNVTITTSQNVDIEYETANVGDRILTALLDYLILIGYYLIIGLAAYLLNRIGIKPGWPFYVIFVVIPFFLYDLLCEIFMNGQSFGKRIKHIKVIKLDGSQPSVGDFIIRWIFRLIDVTILSGAVAIVTIAINGKGQRLGDIAAGTTVVRLKKTSGFDDTIFTRIETGYKPQFPEAVYLTAEAAGVIKEVLNSQKNINNSKIYNQLTAKTKNNIENKLRITSALNPIQFLSIILKDYNFFHGN